MYLVSDTSAAISSSQNPVTSLNSGNNLSFRSELLLDQINKNRQRNIRAFNEVIIEALSKENSKGLYVIDRDKKTRKLTTLNVILEINQTIILKIW